MTTILHADADSFYVSCHRVFDPALKGKAVIVLSNNDSCVVARSKEARALGIKMGQPLFEIRDLVEQAGVYILSSSYALYDDLSERIVLLLATFAPRLEKYSVDESFLDVSHVDPAALLDYGREIRARVLREVGVPLTIGIARTKTLAKVCTEIGKGHPEYGGVVSVVDASEEEIDGLLNTIAIQDVWGVGPRFASRLQARLGVQTAKDFKHADMHWIRRHLTVVGARTQLELRNIACLPIIPEEKPKKGIMNAKTFSRPIRDRAELEEAVATYTSRAAIKLREQGSVAAGVSVFIRTNRLDANLPQHAAEGRASLPFPTAFTPDLIDCALEIVRRIYKEGFAYRKAGVFLHTISPASVLQGDLFGDFDLALHEKKERLMMVVDLLNRFWGPETVFFGAQGLGEPSWQMKQEWASPHYTTRWREVLVVHAR